MNNYTICLRHFIVSVCFLLVTTSTYAQTFQLIGQPSSLNNKEQLNSKFSNYQIFTLDAKALSNYLRENQTAKDVHIELGTNQWDLVIRPNDIRTPQYQLVLGTPQGNKIYPADENVTYTARFKDQATLCSALTIDDDFIDGYIHDGDTHWFIEPARLFQTDAPQDAFILYTLKDVKPFSAKCAVDHLGGVDKVQHIEEASQAELTPLACKQGAVAIAIDNDLYVAQNSSSETVKNVVFSVINGVNTLYASAFTDQIKFTITMVYIATSSASDPYSPTSSSTEASVLLNAFTTWGQAGNFGISSSVFDFGMVFTSRDIASSGNTATVGLAWVGGGCGSTLYQVDEYRNFPIAGMAAVTAHETGHNLNATHDVSSGFIMASTVNFSAPPSSWSSTSISTINSFYPTKSCIAACTTLGSPTADFISASSIGCTNNNVSFSDLSTNEPSSWSWTFSSGTPATSSVQNPSVQWSSTGSYTVSLSSSNSAGSSATMTKSNYVTIIAPPANPCSPTGSPLGAKGITSFQLSNINHSSGSAATDGANYRNLACSFSTSLSTNTLYSGQIGLPDFAAVRIWIDYNNNGSFSDAGELIHTSGDGFSYSGTYSFSFTTPSSPTAGQFLRLRARAYSNSFDNNPCSNYTSATGQTEDYAVYFGNITLPVEMVQFAGKWQNDYAALTWQTMNEVQNRGFEVERSFDGQKFEKISFVAAKGGQHMTEYWFNDYELNKSTPPQYVYYRLKQLDENGSFRYSKVILLTIRGKNQWVVSPNPSKGLFNLNTTQTLSNTVDIEVIDMLGRTMNRQNKILLDAGSPLPIDLSSMANGVYILKVSQTNQPLFVSRLIKD
ncbi:MAG: T9SS type A sorting domain-containing protein [Saprospiraceae bacterium]|nr:T9SS type A sorting domain-containing protein [Saprospiraceae bacterium]